MDVPSPEPPRSSQRGGTPPPFWEPPEVDAIAGLFPGFEIVRLLGRGGMGAVYEATQKSLRRKVAIKILPEGAGEEDLRFAERFRNEAFAIARLSHPGIVNVFDAGETENGMLYYVMEFIDGRDLAHELATRERLEETEAVAIATRVAEALAFAHDHGIVHRDIKPANILLDRHHRIKVADFGLARLEGAEKSWLLTRTGTTMGTPDYIAPELRKAGQVADARSDLFSLGVMFYQMLTGELPRGMFKLPSECVPGLSEQWDVVICRALEPRPEDRYGSAAEMIRDLQPERKTEPVSDGTSAARKPQRFRLRVLAATAVLAGLAAAGLLWHFPYDGTGTTRESQPFDLAEFKRQMESADVETQWSLLKAKLDELNGSDVTLLRKEDDKSRGRITYLGINNNAQPLADIAPVAALPGVVSLFFHDVWVRDLSCLRGMKIEQLGIFQSHLTDLSPLESLPALWSLNLTNAKGVEDFSALGKLKLGVLFLNNNPRLTDISFVREMPVRLLNIRDTGVTDLSPLAGMTLEELDCNPDIPITAEWLLSMPKLAKINGEPVDKWRKKAGLPEAPVPADKVTDLMPLIDVKRDAMAGEWRMEDGRLVVSPSGEIPSEGFPRLELPYAPPAEYDFEVEFEVAGDGSGIYQILSAQDRAFSWTAGVKMANGWKAGFDRIGGQSILNRQDGSVMQPSDFLKAGRRQLMKVEVRADTLRGFLDGEPLVHWGKAAESFQLLDLAPRLVLRNPEHLGLAADNRAVTFHRISVREVSATNPVAPSSTPTGEIVWTDWLTRRLADPASFVGVDWKREPGGVTTGQVLAGTFVNPTRVRDIGVRARYELRDSNGIQISLRERGSGGRRELYVAHDNGSSLYIGRMLPSENEIQVVKLAEQVFPPRIAREGERVLEFRCEGTRLTATLDGTVKVTAEDATLAEGATAIVVSRGALLKGVEEGVLEGASASIPVSLPGDSGGLWTDAIQDWIRSRDLAGKERGLESLPDGGFRVVPKFLDIWFPIDLKADSVLDGSIRVRAKGGLIKLCQRTHGKRYGEETLPNCYQAELNADTIKISRIEGPTRTILPGCSYRIPGKIDPEREHELEFRAAGTELELWYDGETVLRTRDPDPVPGRLRIVADQGVVIQSLETRMERLAGESLAKPEPSAPPALSNVEDVTLRLRELAHSTLGLAADSDSIRSTVSGNTPVLPLIPNDVRNYAVRVSYRGQVQISLRNGPNGRYLYVLCQPHQTLFNKFRGQGTGGSEKVGATRSHPASFDPDQEHELLVVVTGGRFQAWMDDKWWGEGEDSELNEGGAQLMFLPGMSVTGAEVAVAAESE